MKDFKDIQKFGDQIGLKENSEENLDSPYALLIEDIDKTEDRELIYNVLSTSGVDLDLENIKKQLDEGHVLISHLNEAKGATIVDKIKDVDADIKFGLFRDLMGKK